MDKARAELADAQAAPWPRSTIPITSTQRRARVDATGGASTAGAIAPPNARSRRPRSLTTSQARVREAEANAKKMARDVCAFTACSRRQRRSSVRHDRGGGGRAEGRAVDWRGRRSRKPKPASGGRKPAAGARRRQRRGRSCARRNGPAAGRATKARARGGRRAPIDEGGARPGRAQPFTPWSRRRSGIVSRKSVKRTDRRGQPLMAIIPLENVDHRQLQGDKRHPPGQRAVVDVDASRDSEGHVDASPPPPARASACCRPRMRPATT